MNWLTSNINFEENTTDQHEQVKTVNFEFNRVVEAANEKFEEEKRELDREDEQIK